MMSLLGLRFPFKDINSHLRKVTVLLQQHVDLQPRGHVQGYPRVLQQNEEAFHWII
jgi:hypothetical protein